MNEKHNKGYLSNEGHQSLDHTDNEALVPYIGLEGMKEGCVLRVYKPLVEFLLPHDSLSILLVKREELGIWC